MMYSPFKNQVSRRASRRTSRTSTPICQFERLEERALLASYSFTPIDFPGARESYALGINDSGAIVGYYVTTGGATHAFLKDANGYHSFDTTLPGAVLTVANGINNSGQIVGMYRDSSFLQHAFVWDGGNYSELVTPFGAGETWASGINDTGVISGTYSYSDGPAHGFVLGVNGYATLDPPGSNYTMAFKINNAGQVVGAYSDSTGATPGFQSNGSGYEVIDASPIGATLTQALGNNDRGQVVGIYRDSQGHDHGFIEKSGNFESIDATSLGSQRTNAADINESGSIVGVYIDSSGNIHGYVATPSLDLSVVAPIQRPGDVDFGYRISNGDLTIPANVGLYWSADPTFDSQDTLALAGGLISTYTAPGDYSISVAHGDLTNTPSGTHYLLAVVDPFNAVVEFDETNNVQSLALPDLQVHSAWTRDSQSVDFDYEILGGAGLSQLRVGIYRSADPHFDQGIDLLQGDLVTLADISSGLHHGVWHGALGIDPAHPYVLVVADPSNDVVEQDADAFNEDNTAYFRKYVIGVVTHGFISPFDKSTNWIISSAAGLQKAGYDGVIAFDWSLKAALPIPGMAVAAGLDIASRIRLEAQQLMTNSNDAIDVHLIGHGRGAVAISQAFLNLQSNPGIPQLQSGFDKMTMLDPHAARPRDVPFYSVRPGVIGSGLAWGYGLFVRGTQDPEVVIPANLDDSEVYYQQAPVSTSQLTGFEYYFNLWGEAVPGATRYTLLNDPKIGHSEVHDWYQANVIANLAAVGANAGAMALNGMQSSVKPKFTQATDQAIGILSMESETNVFKKRRA